MVVKYAQHEVIILTICACTVRWHCCATITAIPLQNFFLFFRSNSVPMKQTPHSTHPRPWQLPLCFLVSVDLTALGNSHERDHIIRIS